MLAAHAMHAADEFHEIALVPPAQAPPLVAEPAPVEYAGDFRPDLVPAAEWDAKLLYKYMHYNRSNPDAIFPHIIRIVSCTSWNDLHQDFGVVFEHPVSNAEVFLTMRKAFATVCERYKTAVFAYQLVMSSTEPGRFD